MIAAVTQSDFRREAGVKAGAETLSNRFGSQDR